MRVIVIAIGTALTAAAVLSSGAVAKPTREGKVVRVERPKTFARTTLRVCQMESQQIGHGIC